MSETGQEGIKVSKRPQIQDQVSAIEEAISGKTPNTNVNKAARNLVAGKLRIDRLKRDVKKEELEKEKAQKETQGEKVKANKFEELLMIDPLTGLMSERALQAKIDEIVAITKREEAEAKKQGKEVKKRTYAVIFMDLNNLKQVNDLSEDQHTAGDVLLKAFAEILKGTARPGDILARRERAGDEFILILEDSTLEGGLKYWARENKNFRDYKNAEYGIGSIWVSAGLAEATADTIREKIEVADKALRLAKNEAKSRTDIVNTIKTEIDLDLQGK